MDQDDFTDTPSSDDQSHRRSFGGLGRGPAALLLAAGLLIGGGIGGFVAANAASTRIHDGLEPRRRFHPCPNMGGSQRTDSAGHAGTARQ